MLPAAFSSQGCGVRGPRSDGAQGQDSGHATSVPFHVAPAPTRSLLEQRGREKYQPPRGVAELGCRSLPLCATQDRGVCICLSPEGWPGTSRPTQKSLGSRPGRWGRWPPCSQVSAPARGQPCLVSSWLQVKRAACLGSQKSAQEETLLLHPPGGLPTCHSAQDKHGYFLCPRKSLPSSELVGCL